MKIYSAENLVDAQRVADTLEDARIECRVNGTFLSGVIGELPPGDIVSVWIKHPEDKDKARAIINEIEREKLIPRGKDIQCHECGETLESQFTHCWNCGSGVGPT